MNRERMVASPRRLAIYSIGGLIWRRRGRGVTTWAASPSGFVLKYG